MFVVFQTLLYVLIDAVQPIEVALCEGIVVIDVAAHGNLPVFNFETQIYSGDLHSAHTSLMGDIVLIEPNYPCRVGQHVGKCDLPEAVLAQDDFDRFADRIPKVCDLSIVVLHVLTV